MISVKQAGFSVVGLLTLVGTAGCGAGQVSGGSSAPASASAARSSHDGVYAVTVNRTAEMIDAGHTASFLLTAWTKSGKPAAHQPVTFYIGTMMPLSGMPPAEWLASNTSAASSYIQSYSRETNSSGQAELVLSAQRAGTMEMVGTKIGDLSSYSQSAMAALGSLDAWWTTPATSPTAPVGDSVTVRPFLTKASRGSAIPITVTVDSPSGPVPDARVNFIPKQDSSMMASMSNAGGYTVMTNQVGQAVWRAMAGTAARKIPIRIVVTEGASMTRVAGGMNTEIVVP